MKHLVKLALLLLALLLPATATAHDFEVDGIYYNILNDNEVEVTYRGANYASYSNEYSGAVTIPSTVNYNGATYSVTTIGDMAFGSCYKLTSIDIPNSVTIIGGLAFDNCSGLTSATIPNSVTTIGYGAFENCSGLTSIDIPNSITTIGNGAFSSCSGLTSIIIPNSVTTIGDRVFFYCRALTSIEIPNSVTSIGNQAFSYCSGLTCVTIPNSVTSIGFEAFSYCSSLTSIEIPNSVTSIGDEAFYNCSSLTSIEIPNSVTSLGTYVFHGTAWFDNQPDGLVYAGLVAYNYKGTMPEGTIIILPEGTKGIAGCAFLGCSGLTSITIPNSVISIGICAFDTFDKCSGLTSVTVASGNTVYDSRNNCNAIIETASNTLIVGCKNTIIPNSVTSIGDYAFSGCSGLTSIEIPNSVTSIGSGAFRLCSGLTNVTIPNSVTSICDYAFSGCSSLTSIEIPNSVTSIGSDAFYGTAWLDNQPDGLVYAGLVAYKYKGTMPQGTSITLPEGTKGIAGMAFYHCSSLTSIDIPKSVTSIGDYAFAYCSGLTSVTIPNSVTSIDDDAFESCSRLNVVNSYITDLSSISMGSYVFSRSPANYGNRTLHVPTGTYANYQADTKWSWYFGQIVDDLMLVLPGDVNGNGEVTIVDVSVLIDYLLGLEVEDFNAANANVNEDNDISIADVSALIDMLLSGEY